jgi:hypothetical protein
MALDGNFGGTCSASFVQRSREVRTSTGQSATPLDVVGGDWSIVTVQTTSLAMYGEIMSSCEIPGPAIVDGEGA